MALEATGRMDTWPSRQKARAILMLMTIARAFFHSLICNTIYMLKIGLLDNQREQLDNGEDKVATLSSTSDV